MSGQADGPMSGSASEPAAHDTTPEPASSRRELDQGQRALLLLAAEFPLHRMALLRSDTLLTAVHASLGRTGLHPEELTRRLVAAGPLNPADPVGTLVGRCHQLPADSETGAAPTATASSSPPSRSALPLGDVLAGSPPSVALPPVINPPAMTPAAMTPPPSAPAVSAPPVNPVGRHGKPAAAYPEMTASAAPATAATSRHSGHYQPRRVARPVKQVATRGWRHALNVATGRLLKLGPGPDERYELELIDAVRSPISGYRHVVVLSLKGGSGKTTTTVMMGHTFALHRGDRVAAIDASPDAGTLAYRIHEEPAASVRTLLDNADSLRRYVDVRSLSAHAESRLDVIASDPDPGVTRPFGSADYRRVADIMTRFYSLVLTDCGAGLMHDAMGSVLDSADQMVLVMSPAVDGARSASLTLDWLDAHGYSDLVRSAVVVINAVSRRPLVDVDEMVEHFGTRCRSVIEIPVDQHLAEGGPTDMDRLTKPTRRAYLTLAATVADGFDDASARRARAR
ncbi:MAG: hypothetical protein ACRCYU_06890 [Nocardioides sp.]